MLHTWSPSTWEVETRESEIQTQSQLCREFEASLADKRLSQKRTLTTTNIHRLKPKSFSVTKQINIQQSGKRQSTEWKKIFAIQRPGKSVS